MAITDSDFQKIWASTSPLTPYEFSDSNYQQGWNFIGSTPPARQMWDFLQKQNDEKAQWLYNNKLSLSGGTMTGNITLADGGSPLSTAGGTMTGNITLADGGIPLSTAGGTMLGAIHYNGANNRSFGFDLTNDYTNMDIGWNWENRDGAGFGLRSTDDTESTPGSFSIYARDATNSCNLEGKPNGTLTWNGKPILIKGVENGHGIQTGEVTGITVNAGSYKQGSVTFSTPFGGTPAVTATYSRGYGEMYVSVYNVSKTGFDYTLTNDRSSQETGQTFTWIAVY